MTATERDAAGIETTVDDIALDLGGGEPEDGTSG